MQHTLFLATVATLLTLGSTVLAYGLYAYVLGTLIWLIFAAPRLHRQQRQLLQRVAALEARVAGSDAPS